MKNIGTTIVGTALCAVCLITPSCGGGGGGGGGTPQNDQTDSTGKPGDSSTPSQQDYAPTTFSNLKMDSVYSSDWFRIWTGNKARYGTSTTNNNYWDGTVSYTKTGANTARLNFTNMRLDYGMGIYSVMNFTGTLEFESADKVRYSGSLRSSGSSGNNTTTSFSGTYKITRY